MQFNPVGRWRKLIDPVDHFICEWIAGDLMTELNYDLEFDNYSQDIFEEAVDRIMSDDLIKKCFFNYMCFNKGSESYPIDPYNYKNWSKQHELNFNNYKADKVFLKSDQKVQ